MKEETGIKHTTPYAIFLLFAVVAVACCVAAIKRYVEYQAPSHGVGGQEASSMSFEDWKTSFLAELSEGANDSTSGNGPQMSIPSDVTLRQIHDALKARGPDTHIDVALLDTLPSAFTAFVAIIACALQWRLIKGMSTRILASLIPLLLGILSPAVAYFLGHLANDYVVGQDTDLDKAVFQTALSLPLVTAFTIPGFVGLAAFLYLSRKPLTTRLLWLTSLMGTGILTGIVLGSHTGMYDLLYSRGRMHSTAGIGIMLVSFSCLLAAVIISALARIAQNALLKKRIADGEPADHPNNSNARSDS